MTLTRPDDAVSQVDLTAQRRIDACPARRAQPRNAIEVDVVRSWLAGVARGHSPAQSIFRPSIPGQMEPAAGAAAPADDSVWRNRYVLEGVWAAAASVRHSKPWIATAAISRGPSLVAH